MSLRSSPNDALLYEYQIQMKSEAQRSNALRLSNLVANSALRHILDSEGRAGFGAMLKTIAASFPNEASLAERVGRVRTLADQQDTSSKDVESQRRKLDKVSSDEAYLESVRACEDLTTDYVRAVNALRFEMEGVQVARNKDFVAAEKKLSTYIAARDAALQGSAVSFSAKYNGVPESVHSELEMYKKSASDLQDTVSEYSNVISELEKQLSYASAELSTMDDVKRRLVEERERSRQLQTELDVLLDECKVTDVFVEIEQTSIEDTLAPEVSRLERELDRVFEELRVANSQTTMAVGEREQVQERVDKLLRNLYQLRRQQTNASVEQIRDLKTRLTGAARRIKASEAEIARQRDEARRL